MKRTHLFFVFLILFFGFVYRLLLTSNGNFFFNMDNGRDMVDVREMVILHKLRLTGPTSAIDGLYNGPFWYYLLAVPFILSGGNPYASIVMEIILWAIGGFFLLKLVSKWGTWLMIPIGSIWIASDYVVLASRYAFNPNPIVLLTPLFVYLVFKYLQNGRTVFSILAFLLGGLFFNFEMNFGVFIPLVIFVSLVLSGKIKFIKTKSFWFGMGVFICTLLPQIIFDIRHGFVMSRSIINYLLHGNYSGIDFIARLQKISVSFYDVFLPNMMHKQYLAWIVIILFVLKWKKILQKNTLALICCVLILIPFLGYLLIPVNVNLWHLGAEVGAFIILVGFALKGSNIIAVTAGFLIIMFSVINVFNVFTTEVGKPSSDLSLFRNETAAIDYVYKKAGGQNFKVYTYLPSVYDYPYQYLFWWYGQGKYGYIPGEYVYSPNKPQYISNKEKFDGRKDNFSGLVFLIKEPDRIKMRQAWENDFKNMQFISKEMAGPLEVEIRKQL